MGLRSSRRTMLKGTAAAAAGIASTKASRAFAAPAVIQETGSKVKVVYWDSFTAELGTAVQDLISRFNEAQQDVEVEYQFQGSYAETAQKLAASVVSNTAPDLVLLSEINWPKFYFNQVLAPLSDFMVANEVDPADYVESLYNEGVRDGVNYWLPFARSTPILYYNRDAYAEAGLPDRGPETWTEFQEWAPALTVKDGDDVTRHPFAFAHADGSLAWFFQCDIWAFGGAFSDEEFNITIAEPEGVAAGNMYKTMMEQGWASFPEVRIVDFINGHISTVIHSTGSVRRMTTEAGFEVGTAFIPEEVAFGCTTGGAGLSVLNSSPAEKQEAAFKYIAFATSPEITAEWSRTSGYMPVRKSAVDDPEMQAFFAESPNFKTAVDQLPLTRQQDYARLLIPNGDSIIGKGVERIIVNQEDVQSVFDEVKAELEQEAEPVIEQMEAM